jgi:hypothetical protein
MATVTMWRKDCNRDEWEAFIEAMNSGEQFECDEAMYDYWLGVLPPVDMRVTHTFEDGQTIYCADFAFAEGCEPITLFWSKGGRYYGRQTSLVNGGN